MYLWPHTADKTGYIFLEDLITIWGNNWIHNFFFVPSPPFPSLLSFSLCSNANYLPIRDLSNRDMKKSLEARIFISGYMLLFLVLSSTVAFFQFHVFRFCFFFSLAIIYFFFESHKKMENIKESHSRRNDASRSLLLCSVNT